MIKYEWILCPVCGNKTHNKIRSDTILNNFPLFCTKCKRETLIKAENLNIRIVGDKKIPVSKTE